MKDPFLWEQEIMSCSVLIWKVYLCCWWVLYHCGSVWAPHIYSSFHLYCVPSGLGGSVFNREKATVCAASSEDQIQKLRKILLPAFTQRWNKTKFRVHLYVNRPQICYCLVSLPSSERKKKKSKLWHVLRVILASQN